MNDYKIYIKKLKRTSLTGHHWCMAVELNGKLLGGGLYLTYKHAKKRYLFYKFLNNENFRFQFDGNYLNGNKNEIARRLGLT